MKMALPIALVVLMWSVIPLHAASVNQRYRLPPAAQAKVNNAVARSYLMQGSASSPGTGSTAQSEACGETRIGTVPSGTAAAHLENIVVARGDIITVNRNVLCR